MFFGNYENTLDDKGRLVIPSKFREKLTVNLYLLKGFDGCISIYDENEFVKFMNKLQTLEFENSKARSYNRLIASSIVEFQIDKSGRILLSSKILDEYSIGKNVVINGVLDHFEIWDKNKWEEYKTEHEKGFENDAEALSSYEK